MLDHVGAQISIVTRAGNNDWHATAFDYLRARRRDTQRPRLFFFSHEGLRLLLPETATGNFYTAAARAHVMVAYSDPPSFDSYSLPIDYNDQPDLVASRRFRLSEHFSLYFRAEYFNIFNHPMFAPPSANFNNQFPHSGFAPFGTISSTLNNYLYSGPGSLSPLYQTGGPRCGQLTLGLQF